MVEKDVEELAPMLVSRTRTKDSDGSIVFTPLVAPESECNWQRTRPCSSKITKASQFVAKHVSAQPPIVALLRIPITVVSLSKVDKILGSAWLFTRPSKIKSNRLGTVTSTNACVTVDDVVDDEAEVLVEVLLDVEVEVLVLVVVPGSWARTNDSDGSMVSTPLETP